LKKNKNEKQNSFVIRNEKKRRVCQIDGVELSFCFFLFSIRRERAETEREICRILCGLYEGMKMPVDPKEHRDPDIDAHCRRNRIEKEKHA